MLFTPFRMGRSWKLAVTGYVSTMGTFFFPFPLLAVLFFNELRRSRGSGWAWFLVGATLLATALLAWIFWLCSKLQFAFLDVVLNRSQFITPSWRQSQEPAGRWTRAKMLAGTALAVVLGALFWGVMAHVLGAIQSSAGKAAGGVGDVLGMMASIVLIYGLLGLCFLVLSLVNDFIVPPMLLDNATVHQAWQGVPELVRREPGQVALYALLKGVLGFVGQMAFNIAFEVALYILMLVLGAIGAAIVVALHALGVPTAALSVISITVAGIVGFALFIYVMPFSAGIVMTFLESYKLYFLGGRYPHLGDLLDRSTPPPVVRVFPQYDYATPLRPVVSEPPPIFDPPPNEE